MMAKHTKESRQDILAQIGQIPVIVEGKLSERRDSATGKRTGYKLQRWRDGRNQTIHIAAGLVDKVREGTHGYGQLVELTQKYAEASEQEVLGSASHSKKKPTKR
jgi:hypothetical protein